MSDIRSMEARVEGRKGLYLPYARERTCARLRCFTSISALQGIISGLMGCEHSTFPDMRGLNHTDTSGKIKVNSSMRVGEEYATASLTMSFRDTVCRVYARETIPEAGTGETIDYLESPDKVYWRQGRLGDWRLIALGSKLCEQVELPIVIATAVEPDRALAGFLRAADKATKHMQESVPEQAT